MRVSGPERVEAILLIDEKTIFGIIVYVLCSFSTLPPTQTLWDQKAVQSLWS